jgi:[ribosomal protein S18]-alanine N-acetyltransferase
VTMASTETDVTVRLMRWWDIVTVHAIEELAFPDTAWSIETFWSELAGIPATRYYLVAELGTQIVGYAGLMAVGSEADVQTIAVAPDARRRGVGTLLLDALIDEAGRRGCSRVTLEVAAAGEDARRLYSQRGFEVIAHRTGYYGPGADAVVMRLRLGTDAAVRGARQ